MAGSSQAEGVALGFRVKTGRTVAIVLVGPILPGTLLTAGALEPVR